MIRLDKPNDAPPVLLRQGATVTLKNCEAYIRNRVAYDSGKLKFDVHTNIYGSSQVRKALKKFQHNKCCYCESRHLATSASRIDHFRPHGAVRQRKGSRRLYPGYYWLAYDWDNLVISCEKCNRMKSDYFPLEKPSKRVRNHLDSLDRESPLLLNPYTEADLSKHLAFDGSACEPRTERGRVSVTVLGLNRLELQEERQCRLNELASLCVIARESSFSHTLRRQAKHQIASFLQPNARYSAMVRDYLASGKCSSGP